VRVTLRIGDARADISQDAGTTVLTLDAAPFIEGIRTMVPVRFIAEALDRQVDWMAEWKLVVIR